MKKFLILTVLIVSVLVFVFYPEKTITYPAGITASDQPDQINITESNVWSKDGFNFKALAEYKLKARVLSRNNFSTGKESEISPFDLALGWGSMSDQKIIDEIDISQSNRCYHWNAEALPIPSREISLNSANVHIIPKDEIVEEKFDNVYKGSLIEMKGFLVEITTTDGWRWKSSMKRDDTGGGSCELFWVEELTVLDK
ncbi:MAG: hypothetical protein DAHOPDDO_00991 [Ignavibacteriaceae bacterium]|nr:hypothetical protein [Ignavibacteriaceae bacterium]